MANDARGDKGLEVPGSLDEWELLLANTLGKSPLD